MNIYPLFSNEIDIANIKLSDVEKITNKSKGLLNKYYTNIYYNNPINNIENSNEKLYIQSPPLKFIHPININNLEYNLYIFLIPKDELVINFFKFLIDLEVLGCNHIFNNLNKNDQEIISMTIKSYDIDNIQSNVQQSLKYIKLRLPADIKVDIQNKILRLDEINLDEFNTLIYKIDFKIIFEIENVWAVSNKVALNLKPLKIKIVYSPDKNDIFFRDEEDNDNYLQTEFPETFETLLKSDIIQNLTITDDNYINKLNENSIIISDDSKETDKIFITNNSINDEKIKSKSKSKSKNKKIELMKIMENTSLSDTST